MTEQKTTTGVLTFGSEPLTVPKSIFFGGQPIRHALTIGNIVAIHDDGSITKGSGFTTTDEAALAFWAAIERLAPRAAFLNGERSAV